MTDKPTSDLHAVPRALLERLHGWLIHIHHYRADDMEELEAILAQPATAKVDDREELDPLDPRAVKLIAYGRGQGLDEASTLCNRMAWAAYCPPGTRYKAFTPKANRALGDILIKAANDIASLPDGPYDRFKARQAKLNGGAQ